MTPPDSAPSARREHTPEPWIAFQASGDAPHWRINAPRIFLTDRYVAWIPAEPGNDKACPGNAARIVACVNACAGVSDPAAMLEAMRAVLREADAYVGAVPQGPTWHDHQMLLLDQIRAAMALLPPIRISGDADHAPAES